MAGHPWRRGAAASTGAVGGPGTAGASASPRPGVVLRRANPADVGLDPAVLARVPEILEEGFTHQPPRFAGASVLIASRGAIAYEHVAGDAVAWADAENRLAAEQRVPVRPDTLFDIASLTKIVTATAVMQQVERGALGLADRVAAHLPRFAAHGKGEVTVRQLLSHVGGLPPFIDLTAFPDVPSRLDAALAVPPQHAPGTAYVYSDLGLIALGLIVEQHSGQRLDAYVREHITTPLGLADTMFTPPEALRGRIAATEFDPLLGAVVHGQVHDENARSLDGIAGHAGLFSTARDLAVFAQMFLGGGRYGEARILTPGSVEAMFTDQIAAVTGPDGARRGLGPELAAAHYHGGLTSAFSGMHTGFTGTSVVIDPYTDTIAVLLTNAVHPTREWSTTTVTRRALSDCVAEALGEGVARG